jgi:LPS-assembly protein
MHITPLALAAGLLAGGAAVRAQPGQPAPTTPASASASTAAPAPTLGLQASPQLQPLPRGEGARGLPTFLQADKLRIQPDVGSVAEGHVEFRRGGLVIRADRLAYDDAQDLATGSGKVRVSRDGARYSGPEFQLQLQRFEGYFLQPEFEFPLIGAGGRADRIDFLSSTQSRAKAAEYTSCPRNGVEEPAWLLRADSVTLNLEASEGMADGAVLRFQGVPILALPAMSFPLSDARRSGWLPPSIESDNRSGIELAVPYYWNVAPNRDVTLTPRLITRRGLGLNTEFRYLEPTMRGTLALDWLPDDRLAGRSREAVQWSHESSFDGGIRATVNGVRVSDDDWWKDYPSASRGLTSRLLALRLGIEKPFDLAGGQGLVYARALRWQALQGSDSALVAPYERSPQVGVRLGGGLAGGWDYTLESEFNRFTLPAGELAQAGRVGGERWHLLGGLARPFREPGWFLVPRLSLNAAVYSDSGLLPTSPARRGRYIPTFSVDAGFEVERQTEAFGRALRQTLEPRLLYVQTPYRAQSQLPNYDAAAKDFNFSSIYTDNQFSGVDRVSDAHQLTAGFTTRFVDAKTGAEALRLGLVQRYLFRSQRVTAQDDGTPDGPATDKRLSDVLLLGSTSVLPGWTLDSAVQYSPDIQRSVRSIIGARYSPGPFRTVSTTYRYTRGLSEQMEIGWQWPIWSRNPAATRAGAGSSDSAASCAGSWYAVGRINYSLKDSRVTDSVLGAEYDAGCWIARVVSERLSTGRSEATTKVMLQLELVGLSRIGSNPLKVLKDNIPGYRLLRDERRSGSATDDRQPVSSYD